MAEVSMDAFYTQLIEEGIAPSTRRAHARDKAYFWQWAKQTSGIDEGYPVERDVILQFLLAHLKGQGVAALKVSTLRRYLASLSAAHNMRGVDNPCRHEQIKLLLRRPRIAQRHSATKKRAITHPLLNKLVASCDNSRRGIRDRAILLVSFASGGRRRDELANLFVQDVSPDGDGYQLHIRRSKTDPFSQGLQVPVMGEAAEALTQWLSVSELTVGKLFRSITRHGYLGTSLSGHSINTMIKTRLQAIGIDASQYGSHSLRSGFMTEACMQGIALPVAMQLSGHTSLDVAAGYYRAGEGQANPAAYLLDKVARVSQRD